MANVTSCNSLKYYLQRPKNLFSICLLEITSKHGYTQANRDFFKPFKPLKQGFRKVIRRHKCMLNFQLLVKSFNITC